MKVRQNVPNRRYPFRRAYRACSQSDVFRPAFVLRQLAEKFLGLPPLKATIIVPWYESGFTTARGTASAEVWLTALTHFRFRRVSLQFHGRGR